MAKEILLYDYYEDDSWFGQVFNPIGYGLLSAQNVIDNIEAAGNDDLTVRINSVGGLVFDGFAIYNSLKAAPGKVTVRIEGLAASIASFIAMAGDEVVICQAAMMMIHKPTTLIFDQMDADDLAKEANALTQIEAVLNNIYASKTGLGSIKIQNMIDAESWLTPDIAVMLGFADKIENSDKKPELTSAMFNQVFKNASPNIKAYANNAFKINQNMNTAHEALINAQKENTSKIDKLMNWLDEKFGTGKPKAVNATATLSNGNPIFFNDADTLTEGTQVFDDVDLSKSLAAGEYELQDTSKLTVDDEGKITSIENPEIVVSNSAKDAKITDLESQVKSLSDSLEASNKSFEEINKTLDKLKNVKSNYIPPKTEQEFNTPKDQKTEVTATADELVERYKNRKKQTKK